MQIIGRVRGILGKHFLEINELHIACARGVVRIVGTIRRLSVPAELAALMPVTDKFIHELKNEIKRLPGVKRVSFVQEDMDSS
jgi:hypothetical protein